MEFLAQPNLDHRAECVVVVGNQKGAAREGQCRARCDAPVGEGGHSGQRTAHRSAQSLAGFYLKSEKYYCY
jgi:hypothetical protein